MVVGGRELIDTLWNVNEKERGGKIIMLGINRYIMECKWQILTTQTTQETWINRYIMECKYMSISEKFMQGNRINRYIMECKFD